MNRNRRLITGALLTAPFAGMMVKAGYVHAQQDKKYRFGFSQVTTVEPWRVQFNKDMKAEAAKHPNIELVIADANDRTDKQNADMENFIAQKMDVIFISPKESAGLTGVVEKAYKAGIPVFVLDREVNGDAYTQFVGGDNTLIGKGAGEFIVKTLGGPGAAKGNIVEVWGGFGTQASHDRHDGMMQSVGKQPGLKIVGQRVVHEAHVAEPRFPAARGHRVVEQERVARRDRLIRLIRMPAPAHERVHAAVVARLEGLVVPADVRDVADARLQTVFVLARRVLNGNLHGAEVFAEREQLVIVDQLDGKHEHGVARNRLVELFDGLRGERLAQIETVNTRRDRWLDFLDPEVHVYASAVYVGCLGAISQPPCGRRRRLCTMALA